MSARDARCKWRPNGAYVRPYVELPFSDDSNNEKNSGPIGEIWIGPGIDHVRAHDSVVHLFIGAGMKFIDVHRSSSSYRHS